jgi:hypothetical protein
MQRRSTLSVLVALVFINIIAFTAQANSPFPPSGGTDEYDRLLETLIEASERGEAHVVQAISTRLRELRESPSYVRSPPSAESAEASAVRENRVVSTTHTFDDVTDASPFASGRSSGAYTWSSAFLNLVATGFIVAGMVFLVSMPSVRKSSLASGVFSLGCVLLFLVVCGSFSLPHYQAVAMHTYALLFFAYASTLLFSSQFLASLRPLSSGGSRRRQYTTQSTVSMVCSSVGAYGCVQSVLLQFECVPVSLLTALCLLFNVYHLSGAFGHLSPLLYNTHFRMLGWCLSCKAVPLCGGSL